MVEIVKVSVTDQQAWDRYVSQHPKASPYHRFAWQEAIQKAYGHQGIYLAAKEDDTIVGCLPLTCFNIPLKGTHLSSLPFCDLGGPLADTDQIEEMLVNASIKVLAETKTKYLELRKQGDIDEELDEAQQGKVRMLMPLPESSETLLASFKSKLRSQVRKAEKNGLTYTHFTDGSAIDDFYEVFSQNMRDLGSPVHSKQWFRKLSDEFGSNLITFVVKKDDITVGAAIILVNGKSASIPWASTLAEYNRLAPNMLLYWSVLEHLSDSGITEFDFGRSSYGEGTYKFKKQWGALPVPLDWQIYTEAGQVEQVNQAAQGPGKLRKFVEDTWRKLPLSIANTLGPIIRRYISL